MQKGTSSQFYFLFPPRHLVEGESQRAYSDTCTVVRQCRLHSQAQLSLPPIAVKEPYSYYVGERSHRRVRQSFSRNGVSMGNVPHMFLWF